MEAIVEIHIYDARLKAAAIALMHRDSDGGGVVGTGLNKTLAPVHETLLKPRHVATLALIR
jgi:hypothetical protein